MKHPLLFSLALLAAAPLPAQIDAPKNPMTALLPQPDEPVVLAALRAIVVVPDESAAASAAPAAGLETSRVPWLQGAEFARDVMPFLGQPVSLGSLERLQQVIRLHLQFASRPFARVYAPPQDITDGTVRIVVQLATLDGDVRLDGTKWFARERYTGALRLRPGEALDAAALHADLAWLNRNPFSRVTPVIEAGEKPGTTRVTLRAEERCPFTLNAGWSNTGTKATGEQRANAGLQWGNAFGRGDLLSLGVAGDTEWKHLRSYNAAYTAFLPWRHVLSWQGAYSNLSSALPEPFAQAGKSWQVGARYEIPLQATRAGARQNLSFSADFKYSDNTLEFAATPITGNVTHIAQLGAHYDLGFAAFGGRNDLRLEAVASPGGFTAENDDTAFAGSRPGAKAAYGYAKLGLRHQRTLGAWSLTVSADTQFASGALLGSEQLNGGGSAAVRGYRESSAFGDWGAVGSAELHAPGFALVKGRDRADLFAFVDAASLRLHEDDDGTDLVSAGLGVNYQFGALFSLRAAYGWQLRAIDSSRGVYSGRGHVSANLNW